MDEQVVRRDKALESLEEKFVCVRLVQMKGVDLHLFQFDYDQSWAVVFLNADGAIYGRYGTRAAGKAQASSHLSIPSLKKAMARVLELHAAYPANKEQLAAKLGPKPPYPAAERIPGLEDRADTSTTLQNCIHCHMVTEGVRKARYRSGTLRPADLWIYPLPENAGLHLDVDDGLRVRAVQPDSPSARAGIRAGDELLSFNQQPLISQADVQWVLHNAPVEGDIAVSLRRDGTLISPVLKLADKWKESDLSWRESSWSLRPGVWTVPLSRSEKEAEGLPANRLALRVKWVLGRGHLAKQAGLRNGDLIVAVDGKTEAMDESQFLAYVRLHHAPGEKVRLTLLRAGEREEVLLELD